MNAKAKTIYLDIMSKDRFVCQMKYKYSPIFPLDMNEMRAYALRKRPSLKRQDFRIELSNNRVY